MHMMIYTVCLYHFSRKKSFPDTSRFQTHVVFWRVTIVTWTIASSRCYERRKPPFWFWTSLTSTNWKGSTKMSSLSKTQNTDHGPETIVWSIYFLEVTCHIFWKIWKWVVDFFWNYKKSLCIIDSKVVLQPKVPL